MGWAMSDQLKMDMVIRMLQRFKEPGVSTPFLDLLLEEREAERTGDHSKKTIWRQMCFNFGPLVND